MTKELERKARSHNEELQLLEQIQGWAISRICTTERGQKPLTSRDLKAAEGMRRVIESSRLEM